MENQWFLKRADIFIFLYKINTYFYFSEIKSICFPSCLSSQPSFPLLLLQEMTPHLLRSIKRECLFFKCKYRKRWVCIYIFSFSSSGKEMQCDLKPPRYDRWWQALQRRALQWAISESKRLMGSHMSWHSTGKMGERASVSYERRKGVAGQNQVLLCQVLEKATTLQHEQRLPLPDKCCCCMIVVWFSALCVPQLSASMCNLCRM